MNLAISQNRHILSMIGIPVWASRTHATERVLVMGDRLGQKPIDGVLDNHDGGYDDNADYGYDDNHDDNHDTDGYDHDRHDERVHADDIVIDTPTPDDVAMSTQLANHPNTPPKITTNAPIITPIPKLDIRYHLKGVRFGRWVLVVDLQYIDTDVHSVWLSLCEALERQAQTANLPYRTHEIHYPLVKDDYAEHQDFAPANHACLGFVLGLAMPELASVQIGLLTPLTAGLSIDNALTLTDIRLLARHNELKRGLWAWLNASL